MDIYTYDTTWVSQMTLVIKNLPANAEDIRDEGLIPRLGRFAGERMAVHFSFCLENAMDRGAWWAVHGVAKSQT